MVTKLPASGTLFLFLFCTLCLLCVLTLRVLTTSLSLAKCTSYTFFYSLSLSLSLHSRSENSQETKDIGRDRTRTCNPQIRSLVPYPLGHTVSDVGMFTSAILSVATFINRRCNNLQFKTTFSIWSSFGGSNNTIHAAIEFDSQDLWNQDYS